MCSSAMNARSPCTLCEDMIATFYNRKGEIEQGGLKTKQEVNATLEVQQFTAGWYQPHFCLNLKRSSGGFSELPDLI